MLGGLAVILLSTVIAFAMISSLKARYAFIDAGLLRNLFFYHLLLFFAYYGYVLFNPSDSQYYYAKILNDYRGPTWSSFYGTSTTFIEFVGYPFIRYFFFSYEAIMALFSLFGFIGFLYFYIFFKEQIRFKHTLFGYDLITIFFFLPNLHFWSTSFGKGAIIFLGLGLYFYALSKIRSRWVAALIGGIIIYHVRPHVMMVVLVSSAIGFMFSTKGVGIAWRLMFLAASGVALFFIYQDVLTLVGIDEDQVISQGLDLTHRAQELSRTTSGVDISSYSLPMQVFTFLYRPLFIDAPGMLGIIVSFENVFYLLITFRILRSWKGITYFFRSPLLAKSAFLSFITISVALAQVSGNLGLAMRQKSQVMLLFMFFIISYMDEEKYSRMLNMKKRKAKAAQLRQQADITSNLQAKSS